MGMCNQGGGMTKRFLTGILMLMLLGLGAPTLVFNQAVAKQASASETQLYDAFVNRSRGVSVEGTGVVEKILTDDLDSSRHQRFILRLSTGQTILIAHNIDIAPRVAQLQVGDKVIFSGKYEWNPQGGVVHWTHKDPQGRHVGGWLIHKHAVYR